MKNLMIIGAVLSILFAAGCGVEEPVAEPEQGPTVEPSGVAPLQSVPRVRVATTTSLYDTGLWSYLEPMFEEAHGVELDVLYAGTGKALDWGMRGDVDVITVHSRARELQFVAEGYGVERVPFACNNFLIVGPSSDPAGIAGMEPEEAFGALMESGVSPFISRGDDSGTHSKEKSIWSLAGYDYEADVRNAGGWYVEGGSGMGPTLVMASEMEGYTLTDIGTFLAYQGDVELVPLVDRGDALLNVYSVMAVVSSANSDMALAMVEFLTSPEIQDLIGEYGVEAYGGQLFTPCAGEDI